MLKVRLFAALFICDKFCFVSLNRTVHQPVAIFFCHICRNKSLLAKKVNFLTEKGSNRDLFTTFKRHAVILNGEVKIRFLF